MQKIEPRFFLELVKNAYDASRKHPARASLSEKPDFVP